MVVIGRCWCKVDGAEQIRDEEAEEYLISGGDSWYYFVVREGKLEKGSTEERLRMAVSIRYVYRWARMCRTAPQDRTDRILWEIEDRKRGAVS